jgi:hypothetical protein
MLTSFFTHILLLISCVIFSCSLYSFIVRVRTSSELHLLEEAWLIYGSRQPFVQIPVHELDKQTTQFQYHRSTALGRHASYGSYSNKPPFSMLDRLTFINPSKLICSHLLELEHTLLIVVLSRASNFDYRQAIRATWGRTGKYKASRIRIQTLFFVGTDDLVQTAIRHEQELFNDVIEIGKVTKKNMSSFYSRHVLLLFKAYQKHIRSWHTKNWHVSFGHVAFVHWLNLYFEPMMIFYSIFFFFCTLSNFI